MRREIGLEGFFFIWGITYCMESGCAFYLVPNEEGGVDGCTRKI